jgi:hypothetical protein
MTFTVLLLLLLLLLLTCCCCFCQALSSVLYATSRVPDLPELTTLHKMFAQKYGKVRQSTMRCFRSHLSSALVACSVGHRAVGDAAGRVA